MTQIMVTNIQGQEVPLEHDFGAQAQREAEDHLSRVWAHFHDEGEGDDPAVGGFDGCQTCEVRETLFAAIPFIEAGLAREGGVDARPLTINLIACPQEDTDGDV